jgi:hypothetical protein
MGKGAAEVRWGIPNATGRFLSIARNLSTMHAA